MWQRCGYRHSNCHLIAPKGSKHWLRAPSRFYRNEVVVRCPWHFTDWSMRSSIGRGVHAKHLQGEAIKWAADNPHMRTALVDPDITNSDPEYLRAWMKLWE